jgi:hypothetical protein
MFIKARDGRPLRFSRTRTLSVYGLNCGFELKSSNASVLEGLGPNDVPLLLLKEATIASGPAQREECIGLQALFA